MAIDAAMPQCRNTAIPSLLDAILIKSCLTITGDLQMIHADGTRSRGWGWGWGWGLLGGGTKDRVTISRGKYLFWIWVGECMHAWLASSLLYLTSP